MVGFSPVKSQNPLPDAVELFATEAQACANEMLRNSSYIEKELHRVTMTVELLGVTKNMCASLTATGQSAIEELADWIGGSFKPHELAQCSTGVVNLLSRDLFDLHGLVMALRAQSNVDQKFSLASMLVGESATNILQAYSRVADAAKAVSDAAANA